ncbi:IS3 family transposase [Fervidicella metallireducens]|uniref:IS3 family transposase n=1 Tax=Fervidicella metallireducens TaxID=655338 RepID=UPI001FA74B8A
MVGLSKSTYYYNISNMFKVKKKPVGKSIPGYSFDNNGKKICDEQIKEWIIESIEDDAEHYGYRKIRHHLMRKYNFIINHKKVYRLCKELGILKPQRQPKPKEKKNIAINHEIRSSNKLWEMDIKYGYIHGEYRFFFVLSIIDILDRCIVDYYIGLKCEVKDAAALVRHALMKRGLFVAPQKPIIRTDNGPQFKSELFHNMCEEIGIVHERTPNRTPNKNAHIESFHRILESECIGIYEFKNYTAAYQAVSEFMERYNKRRIHSSLKYKTPEEFYNLFNGQELNWMVEKV